MYFLKKCVFRGFKTKVVLFTKGIKTIEICMRMSRSISNNKYGAVQEIS